MKHEKMKRWPDAIENSSWWKLLKTVKTFKSWNILHKLNCLNPDISRSLEFAKIVQNWPLNKYFEGKIWRYSMIILRDEPKLRKVVESTLTQVITGRKCSRLSSLLSPQICAVTKKWVDWLTFAAFYELVNDAKPPTPWVVLWARQEHSRTH